jgi:hypothetical protein
LFSQIRVIAENIVDIAGRNHVAVNRGSILPVEARLQRAHHDLPIGVVGESEIQNGEGLIRRILRINGNQTDFADLPLSQTLVRKIFRGPPKENSGDDGRDTQRNEKRFCQESSPTS